MPSTSASAIGPTASASRSIPRQANCSADRITAVTSARLQATNFAGQLLRKRPVVRPVKINRSSIPGGLSPVSEESRTRALPEGKLDRHLSAQPVEGLALVEAVSV